VGYAAIWTRPFADVQSFIAVAVSASGTDLAGRIEPVRLDERPAFPFGFVRQLSAEFEPTDVPDRFGKFVVLHQIGTPQRLDHDDLVFVRDLVGEFVQEVLALVRNLFMFLGQNQAGFLPVLAAFLLARQGALGFLDFLFGFPQTLWIRVFFDVARIICGDGKIGKAKIDADFVFRRQPFWCFLFYQNGNEVVAGLVHRNRAGLDQPIKIPVLLDCDETNLRQFDFSVLDADVSALVVGGVGGLRFVFAFEFRKADGFVTEEVLVGLVQILVGIRQSQVIHLFQERKFFFEGRIGPRLNASQ